MQRRLFNAPHSSSSLIDLRARLARPRRSSSATRRIRSRRLPGPRLELLAALGLLISSSVQANWPMWRSDATRSGTTASALPDTLVPTWSVPLPPPEPAYPFVFRMQSDTANEPIIGTRSVFITCALDASVRAFSLNDGKPVWQAWTGGPVRGAPILWRNRVIVPSDDGRVYAFRSTDGALLWKRRLCPPERPDTMALHNGRVVSQWPVRGIPVLHGNTLYAAAGVWPTMGIHAAALDPEDGTVRWRNDRLNRIAGVRVDHNERIESGLSPHGYLVVAGSRLLIPNGRSMPAAVDLNTGELVHYVQGYRNGDCRIVAAGDYALVGRTGVIRLGDLREAGSSWGTVQKASPERFAAAAMADFEGPFFPYKLFPGCDAFSVVDNGTVYGLENGIVYAYDMTHATVAETPRRHGGRSHRPWRWDVPLLWRFATGFSDRKSRLFLKAGDTLYGHAGTVLIAVRVPHTETGVPELVWTHPLEHPPAAMACAHGRLLVTTAEGTLMCFAAPNDDATTGTQPPAAADPAASLDEIRTAPQPELPDWITGATGHIVLIGADDHDLIKAILHRTDARLVVCVDDDDAVARIRRSVDGNSAFARRLDVLCQPDTAPQLPAYMGDAVIVAPSRCATVPTAAELAQWWRTVHPYGGVLAVPLPASRAPDVARLCDRAGITDAQLKQTADAVLLTRPGPLPGAAEWTHESADAGRTFFSTDDRVRSPLGVLWYGDTPTVGFFKVHDYGLGVKPQVVNGRVVALQQSSGTLYCYDAYTGRICWKRHVNSRTNPYPWIRDGTFEWSWTATGGGITRYASLPDGIYIAGESRILVCDPETGAERRTMSLAHLLPDGPPAHVRAIAVAGPVVLAAVDFSKADRIETGYWDATMLVALERGSGRRLWTFRPSARVAVQAIAMTESQVFCVDSPAPLLTEQWQRRTAGRTSAISRIVALEARSGTVQWEQTIERPYRTYGSGNWISIRERDDWVAVSTAHGLLLTGRENTVQAFRTQDGEPVWTAADAGRQPVILMDRTFVDQSGRVFDVETGAVLRTKPLFQRGGCNYAVGSRHLLLVRDKSICYVDRAGGSAHHLRAARSGCSNSLIPAAGLLNAPNFSPGCTCNYPVQVSSAWLHMPGIEPWAGSTPVEMPPLEVTVTAEPVTLKQAESMHAFEHRYVIADPDRADSALVAHWTFEPALAEADGATDMVPDDSGNALHGRRVGSSGWTRHRNGRALLCGGSDAQDRVTIPWAPALTVAEAVTLCAWVRLGDRQHKGYTGIVECPQYYRLCVLNTEPPYQLVFNVQLSSGTWLTATTEASLAAATWFHVAGTFDSETGDCRIFVDGVRAGGGNGPPGGEIPALKRGLTIGVRDGSAYFHGAIDEVRMYNRALGPAVIDHMVHRELSRENPAGK